MNISRCKGCFTTLALDPAQLCYRLGLNRLARLSMNQLCMYSFQPRRSKAYSSDMRWRMVYQRYMTGLTYEQIGANLNVDPSTVYRVVKRFDEDGEVGKEQNCGAEKKLTLYDELLILQIVLDSPSVYLHEIQRHVEETTTTVIDESTICRFLQSQNFSRKKLTKIACQRSEELREKFVVDCYCYTPDMLIFVDETGCDKRSALRRFGYSLKGYNAHNTCII